MYSEKYIHTHLYTSVSLSEKLSSILIHLILVKHYRVYSSLPLSLFVTHSFTNKCPFCFQPYRIQSKYCFPKSLRLSSFLPHCFQDGSIFPLLYNYVHLLLFALHLGNSFYLPVCLFFKSVYLSVHMKKHRYFLKHLGD